MTPDQATAVRDYFVGLFQNESKTTRRVIAAAPVGKDDYAPSERCMVAGKLMRHICESEVFFLNGIANGHFNDRAGVPAEVTTPEGVVAWYDEQLPAALKRVAAISGEDLLKPIPFYQWTMPGMQFLSLSLLHAIHHRGQLSAYLRPMGGKVPGIYGPSGDDAK